LKKEGGKADSEIEKGSEKKNRITLVFKEKNATLAGKVPAETAAKVGPKGNWKKRTGYTTREACEKLLLWKRVAFFPKREGEPTDSRFC